MSPIDPGPPPDSRAAAAAAAELAARLLSDYTEPLLNAIDDGVYCLDSHGRTIFVNEAASRMLGYTQREILGRHQHQLIHYKYADGSEFPVENCPIFGSAREGVQHRVGGDVFWRKDGTPLLVDYTSIPVKEGRTIVAVVVTFRDVSAQREAREAKARLAELLTVFEHSPSAICLMEGESLVIRQANKQYRRFAGPRELIGRPAREAWFEDRYRPLIDQLAAVYRTGEPFAASAVPVELVEEDGGTRAALFDLNFQPLRTAGMVTGILVHAVDVTDRIAGSGGNAPAASEGSASHAGPRPETR